MVKYEYPNPIRNMIELFHDDQLIRGIAIAVAANAIKGNINIISNNDGYSTYKDVLPVMVGSKQDSILMVDEYVENLRLQLKAQIEKLSINVTSVVCNDRHVTDVNVSLK